MESLEIKLFEGEILTNKLRRYGFLKMVADSSNVLYLSSGLSLREQRRFAIIGVFCYGRDLGYYGRLNESYSL